MAIQGCGLFSTLCLQRASRHRVLIGFHFRSHFVTQAKSPCDTGLISWSAFDVARARRVGTGKAKAMISVDMNGICEPEAPAQAVRITVTAGATEAFSPNVSVWLVDDNDSFRSTLADVLGRQGGIQCARDFSSPDAVLSALASHVGPDVILLDVQMRDHNGLDAIGPIKALARDTQVLMLTSSYDPEGYQRAIAEGASDFLLKSYTTDEIAQRIRNPSRLVNARRSKPVKAGCATNQGRSHSTAGKKVFAPAKSRLGFFRRWLSERS